MHYDKVSVDEVAKDFVFDSETGKAANVIKPVLDKDLKFQLVANKRILWIYRAVATDFGKFALQGENAEGAQDFALDIYSSH